MNLKEWAKQDNLIMRALKVSEISHIVAKTNLGDLNLKLNKDGTDNDYRFTLDAVPFEDKENKELIKLFEGSLYDTESINQPATIGMLDETRRFFANELSKHIETTIPQITAEPAIDLLKTNGETI
jgi:hypothetical protein